MSRISLYQKNKSLDYRFIDRAIYEQFQVSCTEVYVHKYIGPVDPSNPNNALGETTIQDVVFLENRDRKYDQSIFIIRGHYQVQDIDFNLSQFGLFLQNDTVFMTIHINNSVDLIGRKIMSGDVFELPNLVDEHALNDYTNSLKRYYVVEDVTRAAEGFSPTWYPHLYRIKLKPLVDSQEFKDIFEKPADDDIYAGAYDPAIIYYPGQVVKYNGQLYQVNTDGSVGPDGTTLLPTDVTAWHPYTEPTLQDILSSYKTESQISNLINLEAETDSLKSGYETSHFYTLAVDKQGDTLICSTDSSDNIATDWIIDILEDIPLKDGYQGYLLQDGIAPNGPLGYDTSQFGHGFKFPERADDGDFFLRTDYFPNRLFRYSVDRWIKQEDNVRMELSNTDTRQTQKTSFINNTEYTGLHRVLSDTVLILEDGTVQYDPYDATDLFEVNNGIVFIRVKLAYHTKYKVELWLDDDSKVNNLTLSNSNGLLAFTVNDVIPPKTRIRYTVFDDVIPQRQFPSKALRKLKPTADF